MSKQRMKNKYAVWVLPLLVLLALALRLLVWHWHRFYPLGGDEQEYLAQALTLLREHRYVELRLMRPPLYGAFLAGAILLADSLVQHLRLVQAIISAATIVPLWLLTAELFGISKNTFYQGDNVVGAQRAAPYADHAPILAALFGAVCYTFADYATELLAETLFLAGLTTLLWLLMWARRTHHVAVAIAAGLIVGLLCLVRSVALPLIPLGVLLLLVSHWHNTTHQRLRWWMPSLYLLSALLVIAPWSIRNTITYGKFILIDTTGAENLWLDNDPAGREAVKAQLYELGEDRATRQTLAMQQGVAVISQHPHYVVHKAWGELQKLFALEYSDDMQERRAIWVPLPEVWARLLLGDGLFVLLLLAGVMGLGIPYHKPTGLAENTHWFFALWAGYVVFTAMLFHVELRYRLPLYPVLIPYAAHFLQRLWQWMRTGNTPFALVHWRTLATLGMVLCIITLMLLHKPYPLIAWQLGRKHIALAQAEQALQQHDPHTAQHAAQHALARDHTSALARVALARAALQQHDTANAEQWLHEAIDELPAHAHAHLLRGDILRQHKNLDAAQSELAYETTSLQDLQAWSWQWFTTPPSTTLDLGNGLDLGMIRGFHFVRDGEAWRWSKGTSHIRLAAGDSQYTSLRLRLASGLPPHVENPLLQVTVAGTTHQIEVAREWNEYTIPLASAAAGVQNNDILVVELQSETFTPRQYDPASDDGRTLGVMVDYVEIVE